MTDSSSNLLLNLLKSRMARIVFLAAGVAILFFISEHTIAMSKTANFVMDIEEQESWAAGGNKLRQLAFLSVAVIGVLSVLLGRMGKFRLTLPVALVFLYVFWAGASVTWSIDSGASIRRYIVMFCCVVGCFGFARFFEVKDVVLAAVILPLIFLVIGVAAEIFYGSFRPYLGDYRFAGTIHPNNQAAHLAMGAIAAFTMVRVQPKAKVLYYGAFCILFLFLMLTRCRSATLTVPVALGAVWLISQPSRNIFVGVMGGVWAVAFIGLICLIAGFDPISEYQEVLLMGRGEETGASLTGRLPLWEDLFVYISFEPFFGYGYRAFWTPKHIYEIAESQEWVISEAHSSYMETTLQLGIIGLIMLYFTEVVTFLYTAIHFRKFKRPEYLYLVGGIFFCIVRGFTESGLGDPSAVTAFLFLGIAAHSWNGHAEQIDKTNRSNDYRRQLSQPLQPLT